MEKPLKQITTKRKSSTKRNGPGRPEGQTNLRDKILDVGERHFAEVGYAGTSMRQVAVDAEVNTALISYYFSSKENLFREVFIRKGTQVAGERMVALEKLRAEKALSVESLVRAFLTPPLLLRETQQGWAFLRLHARLHMEPESLSYELRSRVYDESTHAFAREFSILLPQRSLEQIYFDMSLMIGAYLYVSSDSNRLSQLVPDRKEQVEPQKHLDRMVEFITKGMVS